MAPSTEAIERALQTDRTIDIVTTGARTGRPRTVEIWFHNLDGELFICGTPGGPGGPGQRQPRDWLANLKSHPQFEFRLKESVRAVLPARATVVDDPDQRRRYLSAPTTRWYRDQGYSVDDLVRDAPLVAVTVDVGSAREA